MSPVALVSTALPVRSPAEVITAPKLELALQDRVASLEGIVKQLLEADHYKEIALLAPTTETDPDEKIIDGVLAILASYGHFTHLKEGDALWEGKQRMFGQVKAFVKEGRPVQMILPAFPFKSPNRGKKVLGTLPDLGEEFALAHLQGLCANIQAVYNPGAEVFIASDGLVYNDILGVSDEEVWNYGNALRQLAITKQFSSLKFLRLTDLMDICIPEMDEKALRNYFLTHASCWRRELLTRYTDHSVDTRQRIKENPDTCMTFRGYIKFLSLDLESRLVNHPKLMAGLTGKRQQKQMIEQTARDMIGRGQAFAAAIQAKFSNHLRLSIHPSTGGNKIPLSLIPQGKNDFGRTPWHSCLAINLDGTTRTVHAEEVKDTHDLVHRDGVPYYYREKSDLWDWGILNVDFEPLYPCGLVIRPQKKEGSEHREVIELSDLPMNKLRKLSNYFSPVVCRGFSGTTDEPVYQKKAYELGDVQTWSFGIMQKVKDAGRSDKMGNNVTSNEAMPMHFDGMFKFKTVIDDNGNETEVQDSPGYQYFTCLAAAPPGDGYTLFASSPRLFKFLPQPYTVDRLQQVKWSMDNDGFWSRKMTGLPLVVSHPETGIPCVRFHDPWDSSQTKFSTCHVTIDNDEQNIVDMIKAMLYDQRVCLRFAWEFGDILISDNYTMLHTRTAYDSTHDRELWRIHVN